MSTVLEAIRVASTVGPPREEALRASASPFVAARDNFHVGGGWVEKSKFEIPAGVRHS
jgi:hypothetical protein